MADSSIPKPARPARLHVRVERAGDRLCVAWRRWNWMYIFSWGLWITATGGIFSSGKAIDEGSEFYLVLAIAFWAGWAWYFFRIFRPFIEREELVLERLGVVVTRRVILPIYRRVVPLDEILGFIPCRFGEVSKRGTTTGIEMRALGQSLEFAFNLEIRERTWLLHELNEHLAVLKRTVGELPRLPALLDAPDEGMRSTETLVITRLAVANEPVLRPAGCTWQCSDGSDAIVFEQRGPSLRDGPAAGLLFGVLIWSVVLFVAFSAHFHGAADSQVSNVAWWREFVVLMGFAIVGLVLLGMFFISLLEPFRRTVWSLRKTDIVYSWTWLGKGPSRIFPIEQLDRVELRQTATFNSAGPPHYKTVRSPPNRESVQLALIDSANTEVCSLENLTEADARWIGDLILRARPEWFQ